MPFAKIIGPVEKKIELRSFSPLNTCKTKILLFSCIQGGNISNFNSRKNRKNFQTTLFKANM